MLFRQREAFCVLNMEKATEKAVEKQAVKGEISFSVGYAGEKFQFDLRFISIAEEMEYSQKFNDISDNNDLKSQKEWEICKSALIEFSMTEEGGRAIAERFTRMDIKSERIIRTAYAQFRSSLQPDVFFA